MTQQNNIPLGKKAEVQRAASITERIFFRNNLKIMNMKNFNTNDLNYSEVSDFMTNDFFHYNGSVKKSKSMKFMIDGETYRVSVSVEERDYIKIEKKGENGYETIKEKKARINQITLFVAQDMLWDVLFSIAEAKEEEEVVEVSAEENTTFSNFIDEAIKEGNTEAIMVWDSAMDKVIERTDYKEENFLYDEWKPIIIERIENEEVETIEKVAEKIKNEWTKFAKDYAEAVADADDVTFNYRDREYVSSFEDGYDSAKHSFISMKNLEMGEETNKYLEEAYSINDFVRHYYSYAVERGYIKDYDIDYNSIISVERI